MEGIFHKLSKRSSPTIYDVVNATMSTVCANDNFNFGPYNPLFNNGKACHSDYITPYNYLELKLNNYNIQPTQILSKSYSANYPISFNITGIDRFNKEILLVNKVNSDVLKDGKVYKFEVSRPLRLISIKFQLTDKRHYGVNNPDWALELFIFDMFGTLRRNDYYDPTQVESAYSLSCFLFPIYVINDC